MALKNIESVKEMENLLSSDSRNYVLLYKKGSEQSDCSYQALEQASALMPEVNVLAADVSIVRDIHVNYGIETVPTLLVFDGTQFEKTIKGCNDKNFYKSLFENAVYVAKMKQEGKPAKRVTVYSTPTCSWCNTLKTHLKQNNIPYTEVDVLKNQQAAEEMVRRSGQQGVPQTEINGEIIVGFDKTKLNSLLGIN